MTTGTSALNLVEAPATGRRPWLKFFPSDWLGDELLRMCSLGAHGLLAALMCVMHKAVPYGHVLVNGRAPTDVELARIVGAQGVGELLRLRAELIDRGVLSVTADGVMYSRRMVRTERQSSIGRATGLRGGNPALRRLTVPDAQPLTQPLRVGDNTQIPDARCQIPQPPLGLSVDPEIAAIASEFLERYPEVYAKCRNGAAYRVKQERDLGYSVKLARGWPDVRRLAEMLEVFLLRADIGNKNVPGTPGQFLHMAPDCDHLIRKNRR